MSKTQKYMILIAASFSGNNIPYDLIRKAIYA